MPLYVFANVYWHININSIQDLLLYVWPMSNILYIFPYLSHKNLGTTSVFI